MSGLLNKLKWLATDRLINELIRGIAMRAVKAIECRDNKIAQLEQEVKELRGFVELVDLSGVAKTSQEIADALEQLQEQE